MIPKVKRPKQRRMIPLEVVATERLSPGFVRITFGGAALTEPAPAGRDHTVRLFFPRDGQHGLWLPSLHNDAWMAETLIQPKSRRPWVRNYTVSDLRPGARELDIEFALHGDTGPASAWASRARPGDPAGVFDEGYSYLPAQPTGRHLFAADESALPAVLSILAGAPPALTGDAFLEVPETADIRTKINHPPGVRVHWLPRDGAGAVPGALALDAVRTAPDLPTPSYVWAAGESRLPTGVRRHLVADRGIAKSDIAFIGYWRHGRSSPG